MDLTFDVGEKADDETSAFITNGWATVSGPNRTMVDSKSVVITARENGVLVAAIKGWTAGGVGYASELMVASEFRGRGIGTKMLSKFEDACRANNARRLAMHALANSDEQRLYERLGWRVELEIEDWLEGQTYFQMRKDIS